MAAQQIKEAFSIFDADKSGKITASEMRKILSRGDNQLMSAEEIDAVIAEFDQNGDGMLSIGEFANACATMSDEEGAALQEKLDEHIINEAFQIFDADEDGRLGRADLSGILMRQQWDKPERESILSAGEISQVLSEYSDGTSLSLADFTRAVMELTDAEAEMLKARMQEVVKVRAKLRTMHANRPVNVVSAVAAEESVEAGSRLHMVIVALDYKAFAKPGYDCKSSTLTCANDAIRMAALARRCGCTDITTLVDVSETHLADRAAKMGLEPPTGTTHPSTANISAAFREIGGRARSGDTVLFFYSGHGTYYNNDRSGDEKDGKDGACARG